VTKVSIHVGKLVLHGLPAGDGRAIGRAVEGELARLAAEPGGPFARPASSDPSDPDPAPRGSGEVARQVGGRLGQAISGPARNGKGRP
jgi:hypothetical protein